MTVVQPASKCPGCGNSFEPSSNRITYCSVVCRRATMYARRQTRTDPGSETVVYRRECRGCGETFEAETKSSRRAYCNRRCYESFWTNKMGGKESKEAARQSRNAEQMRRYRADPEVWNKHLAQAREWHRRTRESRKTVARNGHLRRTFGMTISQYDEMLASQNGRCAVCSVLPGDRPLVVDHNHESGKVRALLCDRCNTTVGFLETRPELVDSCARYIEGFK
jgi:hypothetical protein